MLYSVRLCGSLSSTEVYVSFMLRSLLLLVETIYTLYPVILAYHTIQDVEYYQLANRDGRASGN